MPEKNVHNVSQSHVSINENTTGNSFNNKVTTAQGPTGDDNEIESHIAWTLEMLMNDGDISMTMMNGLK